MSPGVPNPADRDETTRVTDVYASYERGGSSDRWSQANPGNAEILRERERILREMVGSLAGPVLDLGCGAGGDARLLSALGASWVAGVDLQYRLIEQRPFRPSLSASGAQLPFRPECFSLVMMSTLLSSVLDRELRASITTEVDRVLRPGGRVVVYDMRVQNPANRQVMPIALRGLLAAFPGYDSASQSLTIVPQLARRLPERLAPSLYRALSATRVVRTHRLTVLVKP